MNQLMDRCFKRRSAGKKGANKMCPKYVEISKQINALSKKGKIQREVAQVYRKKILKLNEEAVAEM